MLVFKDTYSVGIELIDDQHKHLFEIGNRIYTLLKSYLLVDKHDKIMEILLELKNYAIYHFQTEEALMLKINCLEYDTQKAEHAIFIDKLELLTLDLAKMDTTQDKYIVELLAFTFDWIVEHILKNDIKIKNYTD